MDGYTRSQVVSLSRTDFLTPNQIGLWVNAYVGGGSSPNFDVGLTLFHWKQY